jgi:adenosine deaminase
VNPDITEEIIRALPKTDLHCNLDGSVSIPWIWYYHRILNIRKQLHFVKVLFCFYLIGRNSKKRKSI